MLGQALDPLQAAEDAQAGLTAEDGLRGLGLEQFIGRDVEGCSKPDDHVGVEAELAALVIGENGLDNASAFGEFNLGPAALLAEAGEALSHRFQAGVQAFVSGAFTRHIGVSVKASCKLHGGLSLTHTVIYRINRIG